MQANWITPQNAFNKLMAHHYPGKRTGSSARARMALVGALRAGVIEWQCQTWFEKYISHSGATYDENGGPTNQPPKYGYPADFWRPEMCADDVCWTDNIFTSYGNVSLNDAPHKVRLWLRSNGEATAEWTRSADGIAVNWDQVRERLWDSGWQAWITHTHEPKGLPKRSRHYKDALIRLIGLAVREPDAITDRTRLFDELSV